MIVEQEDSYLKVGDKDKAFFQDYLKYIWSTQ